MRRTVKTRNLSSRVYGYGKYCAVCPFCNKICDREHAVTNCEHLVRWKPDMGEPEAAIFTDGVNETEE